MNGFVNLRFPYSMFRVNKVGLPTGRSSNLISKEEAVVRTKFKKTPFATYFPIYKLNNTNQIRVHQDYFEVQVPLKFNPATGKLMFDFDVEKFTPLDVFIFCNAHVIPAYGEKMDCGVVNHEDGTVLIYHNPSEKFNSRMALEISSKTMAGATNLLLGTFERRIKPANPWFQA